MKKFLIAGTSLAAAAAGSAGAVDVTLGGSINMGVEYGLGKNNNDLQIGAAFNEISLSLNAAHSTDGGLVFGGGFTLGTAAELEFDPYHPSADAPKYFVKRTVDARTDIINDLYNVSGGGAVSESKVVSVKINSDWHGINEEQKEYTLTVGSFTSSNICKLAGVGSVRSSSMVWAGDNPAPFVTDAYLPAGRFEFRGFTTGITSSTTPTQSSTTTRSFTARNSLVGLSTSRGARAEITQGTARAIYVTTTPFVSLTLTGDKGAVHFGGTGSVNVTSAAIFVGPFMEVKMASSETKMVVGAACLEGVDSTDTKFYMNNASDVVTISDASIYIEGGFGKLTLQTGDYAGGVGAIAGAGDQADIDADGLVVIAQGVGLMGANPYLAVDLAAGDTLGQFEVITGGTMDLGGLALAFDMALDNSDSDDNGVDLFGVSAWDLGASYAMGDLSLAFATDSSSDWGLSASMAIAGFGVSTTFGSKTAGDHEKSGITYSVSATTALNGFGLAIGFDQDLQPTIGVDYDLGGLKLYAGYDAADEGGKVGATLSF